MYDCSIASTLTTKSRAWCRVEPSLQFLALSSSLCAIALTALEIQAFLGKNIRILSRIDHHKRRLSRQPHRYSSLSATLVLRTSSLQAHTQCALMWSFSRYIQARETLASSPAKENSWDKEASPELSQSARYAIKDGHINLICFTLSKATYFCFWPENLRKFSRDCFSNWATEVTWVLYSRDCEVYLSHWANYFSDLGKRSLLLSLVAWHSFVFVFVLYLILFGLSRNFSLKRY